MPTGKRRPKEPSVSIQEKQDLTALARQASLNTLAHICTVVQSECPDAFEMTDKQQVVIDVEKMNYSTYVKVRE
jgi:hypothetical protein